MSEPLGPDLTLLALLEGLAAAQRMGAPLPLANYVRAYPQHADALLAYAAALWRDDAGVPESRSPRARTALSAGTRHALARLFGAPGGAAETTERLVAEQPGEYTARKAATPEPPPDGV